MLAVCPEHSIEHGYLVRQEGPATADAVTV
jgi:hypothetical protein